MSHIQSDCVTGGVRGGAGVVPGVLWPGLVDGEAGHRGVGGRHPQGLPALLPHQVGGDAHPGGEVDHGVIVVPEHKLRGTNIVSELAGDLHGVPEVDVFLPGPEDGGPGLGDDQTGDEGADAGGGGCLALVVPPVPALDPRDHQAPLTGVLAVQHGEPPVSCEGYQAVGQNAIVGEADPGYLSKEPH